MRKTFPSRYSGLDYKYKYTVYEGGYVEIKKIYNLSFCNPVKRQDIKTFSSASRKRFLKKLLSIDFGDYKDWRVVTGTFHSSVNFSNISFGSFVKRFFINFERSFGKVPIIWKLEFQENGSPHLHMLINYKFKKKEGDYETFSRIWVKSLGKDFSDEKIFLQMLKASTQIARAKK